MSYLAEFLIQFNNWLGTVIKSLKSYPESLSIVILSLDRGLGGTDEASLHKRVLINVIEEDALALADMLLEVDRLLNGSWETVNQIVLRRICNQTVNQDLNGKLKGDEATLSHDLPDLFSVLSTLIIIH